MRRSDGIAMNYAVFSAVVGGVNLASQIAVLRLHSSAWSLAATVAKISGFVAKYLLDKRRIFCGDRGFLFEPGR